MRTRACACTKQDVYVRVSLLTCGQITSFNDMYGTEVAVQTPAREQPLSFRVVRYLPPAVVLSVGTGTQRAGV